MPSDFFFLYFLIFGFMFPQDSTPLNSYLLNIFSIDAFEDRNKRGQEVPCFFIPCSHVFQTQLYPSKLTLKYSSIVRQYWDVQSDRKQLDHGTRSLVNKTLLISRTDYQIVNSISLNSLYFSLTIYLYLFWSCAFPSSCHAQSNPIAHSKPIRCLFQILYFQHSKL